MKLKLYLKNNEFLHRLFIAIVKRTRSYLNWYYDSFSEIFSNVIEGSLVVSIDNIPGKYEIDSRSHILSRILTTKEYEYHIVEKIKSNTLLDKDAVNIGANIGIYTNLLAYLINSDKRVLAIEPTPNAYKYLKANIVRNNNLKKVIPFNGIAAETSGRFKLNLIVGNEEYSSIGEIIHPAVINHNYETINVDGETIDHLVEKYCLEPGIFVIDVEGAEFQVLSGALYTIKKFKPIIISEIDDLLLQKCKSNSNQVIKFLEENDYTVQEIEGTDITFPFTGNIIAIPN